MEDTLCNHSKNVDISYFQNAIQSTCISLVCLNSSHYLRYTVILSQSLLVSRKYLGRLSIQSIYLICRLLSIQYLMHQLYERDVRICEENKIGKLILKVLLGS